MLLFVMVLSQEIFKSGDCLFITICHTFRDCPVLREILVSLVDRGLLVIDDLLVHFLPVKDPDLLK